MKINRTRHIYRSTNCRVNGTIRFSKKPPVHKPNKEKQTTITKVWLINTALVGAVIGTLSTLYLNGALKWLVIWVGFSLVGLPIWTLLFDRFGNGNDYIFRKGKK